MYQYEKSNYVGRTVQLYPGDSVSKWGVIENVDDLGFTIRVTKVAKSNYDCGFDTGATYFINHSKNLIFKFID